MYLRIIYTQYVHLYVLYDNVIMLTVSRGVSLQRGGVPVAQRRGLGRGSRWD